MNKGTIVAIDSKTVRGTADAMNTQKKTVEKIVEEKKADYVVALKANHETLHQEVVDYFKDAKRFTASLSTDYLDYLLNINF